MSYLTAPCAITPQELSRCLLKNNIPNFESLPRKNFSFTSRWKCSSNTIISTIESCWIFKYAVWKPWHIDRLFIQSFYCDCKLIFISIFFQFAGNSLI